MHLLCILKPARVTVRSNSEGYSGKYISTEVKQAFRGLPPSPQGLAEVSLAEAGASFRRTIQLTATLSSSTALCHAFAGQCCCPLSLPDPTSQAQPASIICNLPTITFGNLGSQGHGTAKPAGLRGVGRETNTTFSGKDQLWHLLSHG